MKSKTGHFALSNTTDLFANIEYQATFSSSSSWNEARSDYARPIFEAQALFGIASCMAILHASIKLMCTYAYFWALLHMLT